MHPQPEGEYSRHGQCCACASQELCDEGSSLVDETSDDMNTDRELRARAVSRDLVCVLRGEKTAHHTGPSLLPKAAENPP